MVSSSASSCFLGFFLGLLFLRSHAGRDLFLPQRGQQVLEALAVVFQHVPQPGQRQHGFPTQIEEDLGAGLLVGTFQPVVEQTLVDQADELRAEIGVIDRAFHEGLLMSLAPRATGHAGASAAHSRSWHRQPTPHVPECARHGQRDRDSWHHRAGTARRHRHAWQKHRGTNRRGSSRHKAINRGQAVWRLNRTCVPPSCRVASSNSSYNARTP